VLSAVGLLISPRRRDAVRSWATPTEHGGIDAALAELSSQLLAELHGDAADALVTTALDCRYAGQSHELRVPDVAAFHAEHRRRNGYARDDVPIEVIAVRARARVDSELAPTDLPAVARAEHRGPTVAAEADCTVWIPEGWRAVPHEGGAWVLHREGAA
jgi:N-methylhydantoinase A/oxoprolinase/acetone carboxylase beta subunit